MAHDSNGKVVQGSSTDRHAGCLLGLAIGDGVGAAVEFKPPGAFEPLTDMIGGGPHGLEPGQWTDDTAMALCLAESLIECNGFDPADQMRRYVRWWREGHLSCKGHCFDIGNTIRAALARFERDGDPYAGSDDPHTAGNGSIMRLAPVPMFFASEPERAIEFAALSSRTTHAAPEAVDACRYLAGLIVGALEGRPKDELLGERFTPVSGLWDRQPLAPRIDEIARGSFRTREPPAIVGSGYVGDSLEAALWALDRTTDFRTGCLAAANLGNDADTTAAVYGQLAGAFYGVSGMPGEWVEQLAWAERIRGIAGRLARDVA